MKLGHLLLATLIIGVPGTTRGERESQADRLARMRLEKAERLSPNRVSTLEKRMRDWEKARMPARIFTKGFGGFRPLIGGMPSGSGTVFGGGYIRGLDSEYFQFQANGRYSTNGYTQFDTEFLAPTPQSSSWFRLYFRGIYSDYTQLGFYGLGNDSSKDDQRFFRLSGYSLHGGFRASPDDHLFFSGEYGRLTTETRVGKREPSIDESIVDAIGFGTGTTDFNVYTAKFTLLMIDEWDFPPVGLAIDIEGWKYDDQTEGRYSSNKIVGIVRGQIPLGYRHRRLAFRFRTGHMRPQGGSEIPFYLMETVGGAKSLRGFSEFRFRDQRNLFFNLEYRWELMPFVDLALFIDGGKVFREFSEFDFRRLHWGYGGGIRVRVPGGLTFNLDLAGSVEGVRIHLGGGPPGF